MQEDVSLKEDTRTGNVRNEKWEVPDFNQVNQDPEENTGADPAVSALFHQLGYLDRSDWVAIKPTMDSRLWAGKCCKKIIFRLCLFLLEPIVRQQNEINLQVASLLRSQLHQVNGLTKKVQDLSERCQHLSDAYEAAVEENKRLRLDQIVD